MVFAPSSAVFNRISKAFSDAGFPIEAHNFYEYSGQLLRLHNRGSSCYTDYPDLSVILSRSSYFQSEEEKAAYGSQIQPVFFVKAPPLKSNKNRIENREAKRNDPGRSRIVLERYWLVSGAVWR